SLRCSTSLASRGLCWLRRTSFSSRIFCLRPVRCQTHWPPSRGEGRPALPWVVVNRVETLGPERCLTRRLPGLLGADRAVPHPLGRRVRLVVWWVGLWMSAVEFTGERAHHVPNADRSAISVTGTDTRGNQTPAARCVAMPGCSLQKIA